MNNKVEAKPDTHRPADTKLVISGYLKFTLWRPPAELAERVRQRWPEMRVVHLPHHDQLAPELPDADIFVGYLLRPEQLRLTKRLKWLHSVAAGVAQLMYPELLESGIIMTNASGVHAIPDGGTRDRNDPRAVARFPPFRCATSSSIAGRSKKSGMAAHVRASFPPVKRRCSLASAPWSRCRRALARAMGVHVWAVTRSGQADLALAERSFPGCAARCRARGRRHRHTGCARYSGNAANDRRRRCGAAARLKAFGDPDQRRMRLAG